MIEIIIIIEILIYNNHIKTITINQTNQTAQIHKTIPDND